MIPFKKNRSYRRFYESETIPQDHLLSMIEAARYSPSSRNIQTIKYHLSNNSELNSKIFPTLAWAGYLKEWNGPIEGERPSAYITLLHDTSISQSYSCDNGIFAQSILLRAVELEWGGCIIASIKREELSQLLELPEHLSPIMVIALGKPKERVVIDDVIDNNIEYWRDKDGIHHVPKRTLEELVWKISK